MSFVMLTTISGAWLVASIYMTYQFGGDLLDIIVAGTTNLKQE